MKKPMKKIASIMLLLCLAPFLNGCSLFGGRSYDGSEAFNEAHPEYNNPPNYMQPGDQQSDGQ